MKDIDSLEGGDLQTYRRIRTWAFALMWIAVVLALIIIILGAYGSVHAAQTWSHKHHAHKGACGEDVHEVRGQHVEHHETATSVSF